MTGIFDGMATVLAGVFGGAVTIYPGGGIEAVEVIAILREEQIEVEGEEGEAVLTVAPTLKIQIADADGLGVGDRVTGPLGDFEILHPIPEESPAADRFVIFALRERDA